VAEIGCDGEGRKPAMVMATSRRTADFDRSLLAAESAWRL
jgi:hypothetical protein